MPLPNRSAFIVAFGCLCARAVAQCDDWTRGLVQPGVNSDVHAVTTWQVGGEERLIIAGQFLNAGGAAAKYVAYWDGLEFQPLSAESLFGSDVRALATFDDGNGPVLYVGGSLSHVGSPGIALHDIGRWDGTSWSDVGGGVDAPAARRVNALLVFDDGTGPALYVGGHFLGAGGVSALNVAKWDGAQWSAVGAGVSNEVLSLCAFDDGTGMKLYAGCEFALGNNDAHMAVWNGSSWSPMPSPVSQRVHSMCVFDDGTGDALYVGGDFSTAGGMSVSHVAKWNGTSWSALGGGTSGNVDALAVHDDGNGAALYAGGNLWFPGYTAWGIAKWDGVTWSSVGGGMSGGYPAPDVLALCELDLGARNVLVAGGQFTYAGGVAAQHVAIFGGGKWRGLGDAPDNYVRALIEHDDGSGNALYAGGSFTAIGGVAARAIARWNGATWSNVADELGTSIYALARFDDGTGAKLIAGGFFGQGNVAAWDGAQWSYWAGVNSAVYSFANFDDGSGPKLYCGGSFTMANNQPVTYVAKWNGAQWLSLSGTLDHQVNALCVFDDGSGDALYVGGQVQVANGVTVNGIAKWNGVAWSAVGSGLGGVFLPRVDCMIAYDDGTGPALYVGGNFTTAGGSPASYLAKWDGSAWSQVGGGVDGIVSSLAVDGNELVVSGAFTLTGSLPVSHLARWNGSSWSTFGGGTNSGALAIASFDDGDGVDLYLAGGFTKAGTITSYNLAIWNRCAGPGTPYCFGDSSGTECVCFNKSTVGSQSGCENSSNVGARLYAQGSRSVASDDQTFLATRIPPLKPCILFAGTTETAGGAGLLFDDGLRCAGGAIRRLGVRQSDANGFASWGAGLAAQGGWLGGEMRYFQAWYRDPSGPCMRHSNLSNGYAIAFTP